MLNIWNYRESTLAEAITSTGQTTLRINNAMSFGEAPYVLTITRGLDWNSLLQAERVLVTAIDPGDPTLLTITRGYDGSTAKSWLLTSTVFVYNLATAAYFYDIDGRLTALETATLEIDLTNVDVVCKSLTVDPVTLNASGLMSDENITITTPSLVVEATDILLNGTVSINGLALSSTQVDLPGIKSTANENIMLEYTTFEEEAKFNKGAIFNNYEVEPRDGSFKFVSTGDAGFWGYYAGKWNKLGFTAQVLVGQNSLMYCYLDGLHILGTTTILVKDLNGTLSEGDTLMIGGNPYTVTTIDALSIDIDPGLLYEYADNTPIMIIRSVIDAADGSTMRYNSAINNWAATSIINIPADETGITVISSNVQIDKDLEIIGGVVMGQHQEIMKPGLIEFRNNNFYGTVVVEDGEGGWRTVQYSMIPDQAFEFLAAVNIPHTEEYNGAMLYFDLDAVKWLPTTKIMIKGNKIVHTSPEEFNGAVTFNGMVNIAGGQEFTARVYFPAGISLCATGIEDGQITFVDGAPFWTGRDQQNEIVNRPFAQLPWLTDAPLVAGARKGYIPYSTSDNDGENAEWQLIPSMAKMVGGSLRYPALMNTGDPDTGDALHKHPWSDLTDYDIPEDFAFLQIGKNDNENLPNGKFTISQDESMRLLSIKFECSNPMETAAIIYRAIMTDIPITPNGHNLRADHVFRGDMYIRAMSAYGNLGGQLHIDGAISVGPNLSAPVPGMMRYQTYGSENGPGDLQGYCTVGIDETGEPIKTWLSLTGGLPQPGDLALGGFINFDVDQREWVYVDDMTLANGILTIRSDTVMHGVLDSAKANISDLTADSFSLGVNDPIVLREGAIKIADHTILAYLAGTWKDLLAINAVDLTSIGIMPTTDGATLRFNLGSGVWEQTTNLQVGEDAIDIALNSAFAGDITVVGDTSIGGTLTVDGDLWAKSELQLGVPNTDTGEGKIRYNGDFEGYIPNIGWVSFTRRFGASVVAPAVRNGDLLVSVETSTGSGKFNWGIAPNITVTSELISTTRNLSAANIMATGQVRGLGGRFTNNEIVAPKTCKVAMLNDLGGTGMIVKDYTISPAIGDLFIVGSHRFTVTSFDNGDVQFGVSIPEVFSVGTECQYGTNATSSTDSVKTISLYAEDVYTNVIEAGVALVNTVTVGDGTLATSPGSIKFENNMFYGLMNGGSWLEFGPLDLRDYFNLPSDNLARTTGDVLVYDGLGRWMESNSINIQPRTISLNVPNLIVNDFWQWSYSDLAVESQSVSLTVKDSEGIDQSVMSLIRGGDSILYSNLEVVGNMKMIDLFVRDIDANRIEAVSGQIKNAQIDSLTLGDHTHSMDRPALYVDGSIYSNGPMRVAGLVSESLYSTSLAIRGSNDDSWDKQGIPTQLYGVSFKSAENLNDLTNDTLYVRNAVIAGGYIVPGMPATSYAEDNGLKGAIRYTSEGADDRGDWEGWDGENWRPFTATGLYSLAGIGGGTLYFDPSDHVWKATDAIQITNSDVLVAGTLEVSGILDITGELKLDQLVVADTLTLMALDGQGVIAGTSMVDGLDAFTQPIITVGSNFLSMTNDMTASGQHILYNVFNSFDIGTDTAAFDFNICNYYPITCVDYGIGTSEIAVMDLAYTPEFNTSKGLLLDGNKYVITAVTPDPINTSIVRFTIDPPLITNVFQNTQGVFLIERESYAAYTAGVSEIRVKKTAQYGSIPQVDEYNQDVPLYMVITQEEAYLITDYVEGISYDTITFASPLLNSIDINTKVRFGKLGDAEISLASNIITIKGNDVRIYKPHFGDPDLDNILAIVENGTIVNMTTNAMLTITDSVLSTVPIQAPIMIIPNGETPVDPPDGYLWGTSAGLFYRAGGNTIVLGAGGTGGDSIWSEVSNIISPVSTYSTLQIATATIDELTTDILHLSGNLNVPGTFTCGTYEIDSLYCSGGGSFGDPVTVCRLEVAGNELRAANSSLNIIGKENVVIVGQSASSTQLVTNSIFAGANGSMPTGWTMQGAATAVKASDGLNVTWAAPSNTYQALTSSMFSVQKDKWYILTYKVKHFYDGFTSLCDIYIHDQYNWGSGTWQKIDQDTNSSAVFGTFNDAQKTITHVFRASFTGRVYLSFSRIGNLTGPFSTYAGATFNEIAVRQIVTGEVQIPVNLEVPKINTSGMPLTLASDVIVGTATNDGSLTIRNTNQTGELKFDTTSDIINPVSCTIYGTTQTYYDYVYLIRQAILPVEGDRFKIGTNVYTVMYVKNYTDDPTPVLLQYPIIGLDRLIDVSTTDTVCTFGKSPDAKVTYANETMGLSVNGSNRVEVTEDNVTLKVPTVGLRQSIYNLPYMYTLSTSVSTPIDGTDRNVIAVSSRTRTNNVSDACERIDGGKVGQRLLLLGRGVNPVHQIYHPAYTMGDLTIKYSTNAISTLGVSSTASIVIPWNATIAEAQALFDASPSFAGRFSLSGVAFNTAGFLYVEGLGDVSVYHTAFNDNTKPFFTVTRPSGIIETPTSESNVKSGSDTGNSMVLFGINGSTATRNVFCHDQWIADRGATLELLFDGFYWYEISRSLINTL